MTWLIYHTLYSMIFHRPFVKRADGRLVVISPIYFTCRYFSFGKNVFIRNNARLEGVRRYGNVHFNPNVEIGNNVSIEQNLHLTCAESIRIGSETAIAANVSITDIIHPYEDISLPPERQPIRTSKVVIGDECKIYNNVVILPGVELGKHCVVGANSVVPAGVYEPYSVIVGSPARVVKKYSQEKSAWI